MTINIAVIGFPPGSMSRILQVLQRHDISVHFGIKPHDIMLCFGDTAETPPPCSIAVAVLCDRVIMEQLRDMGCTVVTCGTALTDTLSVSSIGEQSAAVSLQRSVTTLSGKEIEPCEIPVRLNGLSDSVIITAAAAMLLLCDIPPDCGYDI